MAAPNPDAMQEQVAVATASVPLAPVSTRTPRVLLVEDNPVNLMVGQRLLGVLGITCDTASNGEAALMRMSASRYDVVLMDCQMPVMDGYELAAQLRAILGPGQCPRLIALTGYGQEHDRARSRAAGFDLHLVKPVDIRQLLDALGEHAQAQPGVRPAA